VKPISEPAFVPSEHARHTDSDTAVVDNDDAYLPSAHAVQAEDPVALTYLPATQSIHAAIEVAPVAAEYLPTAHKSHELAAVEL